MSDQPKEGNQKQTRRRAVRLRQEALDTLKEALTQAWNASPGPGKFTREEKASLLGVSRATAERILKREGVDRPSLTLAFKNVGLAWDDSFCEVPASGEPVLEDKVQAESKIEKSSYGFRWKLSTAILSGLAAFALLNAQRPPGEAPWKTAFGKHLTTARQAYHQGNFKVAREQITMANEIARANENAPFLAEARRVVGDLALASGDLRTARDNFGLALGFRKQLQQENMLPSLWEALGNVEIQAKNLSLAKEHMMLSLNGYQSMRDFGGVAMACRGLGTVAHQFGNRDEAYEWFMKGLDSLRGLDKTDMATDINARIALLKRDEGKLAEAEDTLQTCLVHWRSKKHDRWVATTQFQLGTVNWMAGRRQEALSQLKESKLTFSQLGDRIGVKECDQWLSKSNGFQPVSHSKF